MIVDDDPEFRNLMEDIIATIFPDDDVTIISAENGREAIELFDKSFENSTQIDFVITDFVMPEASGSDVIEHIMQSNPVPIVVVSAFPEALQHDFIQEGAIYFLRKPFNISAARNALNAAVALKILPNDIMKARDALDRLKNINL